MSRKVGVLCFVLAVGLLTLPVGAAIIISDFDGGSVHYGGTDGWFGYGAAGIGTGTPAGGSSNWMWYKPNQYFGKITNQDWATPALTEANFNSLDHLEFDVIVPGSGPNVWLPNNPAQPIEIEFQFNGINKYAYPTIDTGIKDTVIHVSVDYSSLKPFASGAVNLSFKSEPGYDWGWDGANSSSVAYDARLYLDNVTLTPEPGIGLLWLAGLAMLRRRAHV
jgi:hypothetical protein